VADDAIAQTPKPPYYAVIFTSLRTDGDGGYGDMAERMVELATTQPGFLGVESVREGLGITVSYWPSLEDVARWRADAEHRVAQERGRSDWYSGYCVLVAKVEREYSFERR
jgi:heme-degrading monooxygenase HmoA